MKLLHFYVSRFDNGWRDYNIVSAYAGFSKGKYFVIEASKLFDKGHTLSDKQSEIEDVATQWRCNRKHSVTSYFK